MSPPLPSHRSPSARSRHDPGAQPLAPVLRHLLAYWEAKRGARAMPARRDLDPTEIPRLLPYLLLTDVLPDGGYRYRLVGTEVERSFGASMTGKRIDELMFGDYLAYMSGLYRRVVETRQPLFSGSRYGGVHGQSPLFTERLMLPLSSDGETVDMVLSAQVFRGAGPLDDRTASALQHLADHDRDS